MSQLHRLRLLVIIHEHWQGELVMSKQDLNANICEAISYLKDAKCVAESSRMSRGMVERIDAAILATEAIEGAGSPPEIETFEQFSEWMEGMGRKLGQHLKDVNERVRSDA